MQHHLDPMEQIWNGIIIIIDLPEAKKKKRKKMRERIRITEQQWIFN